MATAYSTNLALALPATGELSGTWGTTVNSNITNMLDEALGYQAFTATGGSDTLTIPDGTTGVARSIYIQLNGTGGGTVNVPATKTKMYFVFNNTVLAITFKVTGQTGVSIPAAAKIALVSNGTDIIVAQNYFAALTLGAALPVASGGTSLTTLTANNVMLGNGAAAPTFVAPSSSGNVLTSNGTTWTSSAPAAQAYPGAGVAVSTGTAWTTSKATPTGVIVGDTDTQTLTNKTLTAPTIASANLTTALTLAGAAGTNGQVLTSAGSGLPSWATPSSGALTLISSATASNTALISFTGLTTSYRAYILEFDSVYVVSTDDTLLVQFSTNGGSSYITSGYQRTLTTQNSATVTGSYSTTGTVLYLGLSGYSTVSTQTGSGMLTIFAPATSGNNVNTYAQVSCLNAGILENFTGSQTNTTTSAVNAFKVFCGGGNIAGGNFRLYGLANA